MAKGGNPASGRAVRFFTEGVAAGGLTESWLFGREFPGDHQGAHPPPPLLIRWWVWKENVILGKLILGHWLERYRNIPAGATPAPQICWIQMPARWYVLVRLLLGSGPPAAVPLEEFDLGDYR